MKPALQVTYTCGMCSANNVTVTVPARDEQQDAAQWIQNTVITLVARDHWNRSPHCRATRMKELKIPITGVERIGDVPTEPTNPGVKQ